MKETLGHIPTTTEIDKRGKHKSHQYYKKFGGWNKFLESIGETPSKKKNISEEELIATYYELKTTLGHIPTTRELNTLGKYSYEAYRQRFGGWKKFLKSIGERT